MTLIHEDIKMHADSQTFSKWVLFLPWEVNTR
jgi:hypothetical protein